MTHPRTIADSIIIKSKKKCPKRKKVTKREREYMSVVPGKASVDVDRASPGEVQGTAG